jgi:hypothetical protein
VGKFAALSPLVLAFFLISQPPASPPSVPLFMINLIPWCSKSLPDKGHSSARALRQMSRGVMLINTSQGGLVATRAVIDALKSGNIAATTLTNISDFERDGVCANSVACPRLALASASRGE